MPRVIEDASTVFNGTKVEGEILHVNCFCGIISTHTHTHTHVTHIHTHTHTSPFSLLASGSDDTSAILWDPYCRKTVATMATGHTGNIFSVKVVVRRF